MENYIFFCLPFISLIYSIVIYIFNIPSNTIGLGIIFVVISILLYLYSFCYCLKYKQTKRFYIYIIIFFIIILLFYLTRYKYGYIYGKINIDYNNEFLSFITICFSVFVFSLTSTNKICFRKLYLFIPSFLIICTIILLYAILNIQSTSSGGYISIDTGFNYQNLSYYSAYLLGINFYYIKNYDIINLIKYNKKIIYYILCFIQVLICVISGGRGGFILVIVFFISEMLFILLKKNKDINDFYIISLLLISAIIFLFLLKSSFLSLFPGAERIFDFLKNFSDNNRSLLMKEALNAFKNNITFGNGIGSVFYEVGFYSHNLITDLLCETGIVGTVFFVILNYHIIKNLYCFHMKDTMNDFIIVIFLSSIVLNCFSGYWIVSFQFWQVLGFILAKKMEGVDFLYEKRK